MHIYVHTYICIFIYKYVSYVGMKMFALQDTKLLFQVLSGIIRYLLIRISVSGEGMDMLCIYVMYV
jgi:hypothetical protein